MERLTQKAFAWMNRHLAFVACCCLKNHVKFETVCGTPQRRKRTWAASDHSGSRAHPRHCPQREEAKGLSVARCLA